MRSFLRLELLRFVAVGVVSAVIDVGVMQLLILTRVDYVVATSAGFAVGVGINYALHARVTFKATADAGSFARFLCVLGLNYVITLAGVGLAVRLGSEPIAGKVASLPVVAAIGYLFSRHWIFK
jgi:putative flippase GtrA